MFAMANADGHLTNDELAELVTMKDIFPNYSEADIIALYKEYKGKFRGAGFNELCNVMIPQIPQELHMGVLSILADTATVDFDMDMREGSLISIAANMMGISDVAVKTLLLASLSKKLLIDTAADQ